MCYYCCCSFIAALRVIVTINLDLVQVCAHHSGARNSSGVYDYTRCSPLRRVLPRRCNYVNRTFITSARDDHPAAESRAGASGARLRSSALSRFSMLFIVVVPCPSRICLARIKYNGTLLLFRLAPSSSYALYYSVQARVAHEQPPVTCFIDSGDTRGTCQPQSHDARLGAVDPWVTANRPRRVCVQSLGGGSRGTRGGQPSAMRCARAGGTAEPPFSVSFRKHLPRSARDRRSHRRRYDAHAPFPHDDRRPRRTADPPPPPPFTHSRPRPKGIFF